MKKQLALMLAIGFVGVSMAAVAPKERHSQKHKPQNMVKTLNLNEDQKKQMKEINELYKPKFDELRDQQRELSKARQAEVNKILTTEQQEKAQRIRNRQGLASQKQFAGKGKAMDKKKSHHKKEESKLDDVTKEKLKTLKEEFNQKMQAVENSRITKEAQEIKKQELRRQYQKDRKIIIQEFAKKNKKS